MKVSADPESDILYVKLYVRPVDVSETVEPGVVLDYDTAGVIVGIEIQDVSQRMRPRATSERPAV